MIVWKAGTSFLPKSTSDGSVCLGRFSLQNIYINVTLETFHASDISIFSECYYAFRGNERQGSGEERGGGGKDQKKEGKTELKVEKQIWCILLKNRMRQGFSI